MNIEAKTADVNSIDREICRRISYSLFSDQRSKIGRDFEETRYASCPSTLNLESVWDYLASPTSLQSSSLSELVKLMVPFGFQTNFSSTKIKF
jgi:hypothetical protein